MKPKTNYFSAQTSALYNSANITISSAVAPVGIKLIAHKLPVFAWAAQRLMTWKPGLGVHLANFEHFYATSKAVEAASFFVVPRLAANAWFAHRFA